MRLFLCLVDPAGAPIGADVRRKYESVPQRRGLSFRWQSFNGFAVLVGSDDESHSLLLVDRGSHVAVGDVALRNRQAAGTWLGSSTAEMSDLEVVLRVVAAHGLRYIPALLGDFAFLVWERATGAVVGGCDAFATRRLYYRTDRSLQAFASRGELLADETGYDAQYLAELIAYCPALAGRSVYAGVQALQAATTAVTRGDGRLVTVRYWSAHDLEPRAMTPAAQREAPHVCRELLAQAVTSCIRPGENTWAQLSGGLDSSSVVSMAQWLHERGCWGQALDGTVTWVETGGMGADEREFSDAVVRRFGIGNTTIVDSGLWGLDPSGGTALPDEPNGRLPFWAREHSMCEAVRRSGGRVLLTGVGGDQLFLGNMFFFADRIARGELRSVLHDMVHRAVIGRASFWELALKNGLLPLLPLRLAGPLLRGEGRIPPWMSVAAVRRYDLRSRDLASQTYAGRWGRKYADAMALGVAATVSTVSPGLIEDRLTVRHPYLHLPLVEWALRLPPEMCARPQARKWVLREAMRGILPEEVRRRVGKGLLGGVLAGSMAMQSAKLAPLLVDPILGQLGVIDPSRLRAGFEQARHESDSPGRLYPDVQHTLAIEAWLRARAGSLPKQLTSTNGRGSHRPSLVEGM